MKQGLQVSKLWKSKPPSNKVLLWEPTKSLKLQGEFWEAAAHPKHGSTGSFDLRDSHELSPFTHVQTIPAFAVFREPAGTPRAIFRHVRQEFLQTDPSFSMYWETPSTLLSFRVCQQALDSMEEQSEGERRLSGQYGDSSPGGKLSPELCVCVWEQQREKTGFISWVLPTCKAKPAASKCCLWGDAQTICSKHEYSWSLF